LIKIFKNAMPSGDNHFDDIDDDNDNDAILDAQQVSGSRSVGLKTNLLQACRLHGYTEGRRIAASRPRAGQKS
jgi:hypothetical protein